MVRVACVPAGSTSGLGRKTEAGMVMVRDAAAAAAEAAERLM